jgi:glycosyltransferase involved in cell wall biosynthesis
VVVDNAPSDDASAGVCSRYPVTYVRESRPGLNWARTRAAAVATGDIVLFTDDDVVVDEGWVAAMCEPFGDPEVAAVTGLVLALELETPTQQAFERYAGFGRGFRARRFTASNLVPAAAGNAGAGASMALRRALVTGLRLFAHEIDCGTAARSGGDNYAFYLLLRHGHAIYYTPRAVCRHRHRRTEDELVATLFGYSVGVCTFLLRCLVDHGDLQALRVGVSWLLRHHVRNTVSALTARDGVIPFRYTRAEWRGVAAAVPAYLATRRIERLATAAPVLPAEPA